MDTPISTPRGNVEIEHAGARITIPAQTIADLWLERARLKSASTPWPLQTAQVGLPRIGETVDGATFMGVVRGDDGPDYLLFDLGEAPERMDWEAAKKWAEERGGSLPTRREQSVMFGNRTEGQYKSEWYWSCALYAGDESYAWIQFFDDGNQGNDHKSYDYRVRAVRRQVIQ